MTPIRWRLILLAALASLPGSFVRADAPPLPTDCLGFVTARVPEVVGSFGEMPAWVAQANLLDLKLADIQRVTGVLISAPEKIESVVILRTTTALPKLAIRKRCMGQPEQKPTDPELDGGLLECGAAVHLLDDHHLVTGTLEGVRAYLKKRPGSEGPADFAEALASSDRHSVVAWVKGEALTEFEALSRFGVVSVTAHLDFGAKIELAVRVVCGNESKTQDLAQAVRGAVNLFRGQMLVVLGMADARELVPDLSREEIRSLPVDLIRHGEAGLARTTVRVEQNTVNVSASLGIDAKTLRAEIARVSTQPQKGCAGECGFCLPLGFQTHTPAATQPTGRYLDHPPQYFAPSPSFPQAREPFAQERAQAVGTGNAPLQISSCPPAAPAAIQLTIANVRKEPVLLFELAEAGPVRFVQKLPPGEAVDVTTSPRKRWLAVVGESAEAFDPREAKSTWLLRPPSGIVPTSGVAPAAPGSPSTGTGTQVHFFPATSSPSAAPPPSSGQR